MINRRALFSDETIDYKTPYQPNENDEVVLKIRTYKDNADSVSVILNDVKVGMTKVETKDIFDFYEYRFICGKERIDYYFEITLGKEVVYYNRIGAVEKRESRHNFAVLPGFKVPEWALGTIYYQIFTDRFCNGNEHNDVDDNEYFYANVHVRHVKNWNKTPEAYDIANFYGGDLQGVYNKLDYLQGLGVETIYFNPLFVSPSNHKYDTQDYDYIDPHFAVITQTDHHPVDNWGKDNRLATGYIERVTNKENLEKSNEFFACLVKEIHRRGMHVVIDGVFNHCGSFNKWLDKEGIYATKEHYVKGAAQSFDSPYRKYFKFDNQTSNHYEGWWGHDTLPKLNYEESPELVDYIMQTGRKWVSEPYNVDGWRLDVAADLGHSFDYNHKFWKEFRKNVREANPEAVILAEHYGSSRDWLNGKEWDTVMNYDAFMDPVTWFLTGMEKHSDSFDPKKLHDGKLFFDLMYENMSIFPRPSLDSAMNELSNHDHSRFLTRTNKRVGRLANSGAEAAMEGIDIQVMKMAVLMQMTWPGAPAIYYGDEAGQVGWTDPDNRRTYPWGHENKEILDFHKEAIALHRGVKCLKMGSIKPLAMGHGYVAYARFDKNGSAVIAINAGNEKITLDLPVWEVGETEGKFMHVLSTHRKPSFEKIEIKTGRITIYVPGRCGCVFTKLK